MDNPNQEIPSQQPTNPQMPSQPISTSSSSWLKTLSIGLGVVGIGLVIGIGGYLLGTRNTKPNIVISVTPTITQPSPTPIPDPTANWKTYADPTLAASFQYPSSWVLNPGQYGISTSTTKDDWYTYLSDPNYGVSSCRGDCPVFNVTVSVYNNDQDLDLVSYIKKDFSSITGGTGDFSQVKLENTVLASGLSFTKVTGFPGSNYYFLYVLHNKRVYIISVGAGANGMRDDINAARVKQNLTIFDQILSTFKFANQ